MKQRTWISEELKAARIKVQYDEHVKRILGSRQVLARILKGAAAEYEGYSVEEIVSWIDTDIEIARTPLRPGGKGKEDSLITGDNTESKIPGEGCITYDIRFRAWIPGDEDPSMIKLLINIEAQKSFYLKYRIVTRGIFYVARKISEQMDREFTASYYNGLKKVYSIWICMNAPVEAKEKILVQKYGMDMEREMGEELKEMCNLSEAIEEQGIEQGLLLAKKIITLAKEGRSEGEIAEICGITVDKVREITED